ncbi:MAG: PPK2 family polyphosphate kinase [Putridiphycobacter sp.]
MKIKLSDHQTKQIDKVLKEETKLENQKLIEEIGLLQRQMLGEGKHSLLIVLQGMDASGKDGAVRRTFTGVNPNGISVKSFKKPTEEEYAHDFLWRVHKHLPAKGMIQIFNRSHYEDILVPSVYGYLSENTIKERYDHINNFEKLIESNGTKILKFFLHVSKEEQYERLMERVELKEKHWKHNDGDWDTREHWDDFESVYERIFEKCNSPEWHIVPSDRNWEKVNYIAKVVLAELKKMKITWPALITEKFK